MEIVLLMGILLLLGLAAFLLWKIHMLKQDIYGFTKNLDMALNIMLNGEKLESRPYSEDDLWGMIYERLRELSNMYTHKNKEISEEKELLKELVSDISHQTKTPIANVKLYLEMMEEDKENIPEYLKKLNLQADKLDFLLQSMVKISRLETGTIKIQKQKLPITRTLAESIAAVVPKADKKKIQIFVECEENLAVEHDKKWTGEALFTSWQNGGATQKQVIDSIVADIAGCTNQQEALNLAALAFGTMAEDGNLKFITSLTSVGSTYDSVKGSAQGLFDATTTPMQEMESNTRKLQQSLVPLGEKLAEIANTILPPLVSVIQTVSGWFAQLPGPVQNFIVILGALLAAFTALTPVIAALAV